MKDRLISRIKHFLDLILHKKEWRRMVSALACLVVFVTTYALILPALTLERTWSEKQVSPTSVSFSNAVYDADSDTVRTSLDLSFQVSKSDAQNGTQFEIKLPQGLSVPDSLLRGNYPLKDEDTEVGTYSFIQNSDGTYSILFSLSESYVSSCGDTITGHIQFDSLLGYSDDEQEIKVEFNDSIKITVPVELITYPDENIRHDSDIYTYKYCDNRASTDGKIYYTVYVYSIKGTDGTIHFSDTITTSNGATLNISDLKIEKLTICQATDSHWEHYNGSVDITSSINDITNSDGSLSFTLDQLSKATDSSSDSYDYDCKGYKITYSVDVSSLPDGTSTKITNTTQSTTTHLKHEAETTTDVNKEYKIGKNGSYDSATNTITWTITVNESHADIAGFELTDTFFGSLAANALTIRPSDGYTIETDSSGNISKVTFNGDSDGKNTNKYTITYVTTPDQSTNIFQSSKVSNTATISKGDVSKSAGTEVTIPAQGSISKTISNVTVANSDDNVRTAAITWDVKIDVPEGYEGVLDITDRFLNDWLTDSSKHYMTAAQIKQWCESTLTLKDTNGQTNTINGYWPQSDKVTFLFKDTKDQTTYDIKTIQQGAETTFKDSKFFIESIKIDFNQIPNDNRTLTEIEFTYQTTAVLTGNESDVYRNEITVNKTTKEDAYRQSYVKKTDGNGQNAGGSNTIINEDGSISWRVEVYLGQGENTNQISVTDVLPEGLILESVRVGDRNGIDSNVTYVYEDGKFTITKNPDGMLGTYFSFKVNYDSDARTVTTTIQKPDGTSNLNEKQSYYVYYTCKVDETLLEGLSKNSDGYYVFENRATAEVQTGTIGSSSETTYWKKTKPETDTIDKSGAYNANYQRVDYKLVINPEAENLSSEDTLEITDVLSWPYGQYGDFLNLELNRSSVRLYEVADDGSTTELPSDEWSCKTIETGWTQKEELKLTVPDGKKLILEYSYNICLIDETKLPTDENDLWEYNLNLENNASIKGYETEKTENKEQWEKSSTSGSVSSEKRLILRKVEKNKFGKTLPGAQFTLYVYQNEKFEPTDKVYTTNENGLITIKFNSDYVFQENVAYCLKETKAPEGYMLDQNAGCYFYFGSSGATLNAPSDFTKNSTFSAINLKSTGKTIEVENEPIPTTSLKVEKKWFNSNGEDLTNSRKGKISFQICRAQVTADNSTEDSPSEDGDDTYDIQMTIGHYNPVLDEQNCDVFYDNTFFDVPSESTLTFEIVSNADKGPTVKACKVNFWNDPREVISPISIEEQGNGNKKYSYSYIINNGWNIQGITNDNNGNIQNVNITHPQTGTDPEVPEDTKLTWSQYGTETYTLSSEDLLDGTPWCKEIENLPLYDLDADGNISVNSAGKKVHYVYTVQEVSSGPYTTMYDESEIDNGKVTIKNTLTDSFELPETGGLGSDKFIIIGSSIVLLSTLTLVYRALKKN